LKPCTQVQNVMSEDWVFTIDLCPKTLPWHIRHQFSALIKYTQICCLPTDIMLCLLCFWGITYCIYIYAK